MRKPSKKTRLKLYIEALKIFKRYYSFEGCCSALLAAYDNHYVGGKLLYAQIPAVFPEFYAQRPKRIGDNPYAVWFPFTQQNNNERIAILENCIKMLEKPTKKQEKKS